MNNPSVRPQKHNFTDKYIFQKLYIGTENSEQATVKKKM